MTATEPLTRPEPPRASVAALVGGVVGGVVAYAALVAAGYAFFRLSGVAIPTGQAMNHDRALFTAANAATLTGFRQGIADVGQYRPPGQVAAFALVVGGIVTCWTVGGAFVTRIAGRPATARTLLVGSVGVVALVAAIGAVVGWGCAGRVAAAWPGAFDAVSAVGNCGLRLDPSRGTLGSPARPWLLALSVAGGLGPVVLLGLVGRNAAGHGGSGLPTLTRHGRTVVAATAAAYLVGVLLLMLTLPGGWDGPALADASAASVDARSAGFDVGVVGRSRAADWAVLLLMAVGAAPGGTGGGLGVVTVWVIAAGTWRAIRGDGPQVGGEDAGLDAGRRRDRRAFGVALVGLAAFGLVVVAGQAFLLATFPRVAGDRSLFLVVAAASNVGLSHEPVSAVWTPLFGLSAMMLAGRLLPWLLLAWLAAGSDGRHDGVAVG